MSNVSKSDQGLSEKENKNRKYRKLNNVKMNFKGHSFFNHCNQNVSKNLGLEDFKRTELGQ